MNKADLVLHVSKVVSSLTESRNAVNRMFEAMRKALQDGDKVVVQGFGSFHVVMRKSKPARNPRTGEPVMIPPRRRVKFKMAKDLLAAALALGAALAAPARATMPVAESVVCHVDGEEFTVRDVMSATYSGETDLDLTQLVVGWHPMLFFPWTCPRCFFTGFAADFQAEGSTTTLALTAAQKKMFRSELKPLVMPAAPKESRDFETWVRYELLAQRLRLERSPAFPIGSAYHDAARSIRLAADFPPVDDKFLKKTNASLTSLAKKSKQDDLPSWLAAAENLDTLVARTKKPDARLLALALFQHHSHGELGPAQRYLTALKAHAAVPAELKDWASNVEEELYRERLLLEKAAASYAQSLEEEEDWSVRYLAGDLNRRLGRPEEMEKFLSSIQEVPEGAAVKFKEFVALERRLAAREAAVENPPTQK
jgi:DNA-binding protein HU-beta